jgi:hypothetical protein
MMVSILAEILNGHFSNAKQECQSVRLEDFWGFPQYLQTCWDSTLN